MQTHALRLVRAVLADAVHRELIQRNPGEGIRIARGGPRVRDLSDDWLRQDEIEQLLACDRISMRDRTVFACAIGLALRLNDLKNIERAHVHLDSQVPGPHVQVWIQKSDKPHRVPIMPWVAPWIRAALDSSKGVRYLFPTSDGGRYTKFYDFGWGEKRGREVVDGKPRIRRVPCALERAGIKRRIRFHDLRGTTATHLALGSWGRVWSLTEIQHMLAHSDQRVTERYVRRAVDSLATAASATPGGASAPVTKNAPMENSRSHDRGCPAVALDMSQLAEIVDEYGAFLSERSQVRIPPGALFLNLILADECAGYVACVEAHGEFVTEE